MLIGIIDFLLGGRQSFRVGALVGDTSMLWLGLHSTGQLVIIETTRPWIQCSSDVFWTLVIYCSPIEPLSTVGYMLTCLLNSPELSQQRILLQAEYCMVPQNCLHVPELVLSLKFGIDSRLSMPHRVKSFKSSHKSKTLTELLTMTWKCHWLEIVLSWSASFLDF